jgi:hypothetical protein
MITEGDTYRGTYQTSPHQIVFSSFPSPVLIPSLDIEDFHRLPLACNRQNIIGTIQGVGVPKLMNRQYIYTYFSHL